MQMLNKSGKTFAKTFLKANLKKDAFYVTDYQDFKYSIAEQI